MRGIFYDLRIGLNLVVYFIHCRHKRIQHLFTFGFRRLYHHGFRHNKREVDSRRVKAVIQQTLGDIGSMNAVHFRRVLRQHALVHTRTVKKRIELTL